MNLAPLKTRLENPRNTRGLAPLLRTLSAVSACVRRLLVLNLHEVVESTEGLPRENIIPLQKKETNT